jgi:hypothetical protein
MITKLGILRGQLASLRRARRTVRWATAWSALGVAVLWMLAGVFVLDVIFEMSILERLIVFSAAAAGAIGVFFWLVRPLLGHRESDLDMALLVERTQRIDSDLVAALQFEAPASGHWGSSQLRAAVVDYVAQLGWGLNVFDGFSRTQMARRLLLLGVTAAVIAGACAWRPDYAAAFFERLALGDTHYPTATQIEKIVINEAVVLDQGTSPAAATAAEGQPVEFHVLSSGVLPGDDDVREVQLTPLSGASKRAKLALERVSREDRLARLRTAERTLRSMLLPQPSGESIDAENPPTLSHPQLAALLEIDAPLAARSLRSDGEEAANEALSQLETALEEFPARAESTAVYHAALDQMVGSVAYGVYLHDAWTDWSTITLVPLPEIEVQLTPLFPEYAQDGRGKVATPAGTLNIEVLEGSRVDVAVRPIAAKGSVKPLSSVTLATKGEHPQWIALKKQEVDGGETWMLDGDDSPLARISTETRFEIHVTDVDGLRPRRTPECSIRLMDDQAPSGAAAIVSRVVLPTAAPTVAWSNVADDYGVANVRLHVDVYRRVVESGLEAISAAEMDPAAVAAAAQEKERTTFELLSTPAGPDRMPLSGGYPLDLAPLGLKKGDGVNVILEVVDYRGGLPGESFLGDPLPLEISDENGVKLAILEPDEDAVKKFDEIRDEIRNPGESP